MMKPFTVSTSLVTSVALLLLFWAVRVEAYGPYATVLVSAASDGTPGTWQSTQASISGDGRYVAFASDANNLVADDTNKLTDIFMRDMQTGRTTRVSVASDGSQANGFSDAPAISADGRYVTFGSGANNLVAGDTTGTILTDVFVRDMQTGQVVRVSVSSNGTGANASSGGPSISGDGRYVAFWSDATNLVADDTNGVTDVFVHDIQTGQTTRVSVASDGTQANSSSGPAGGRTLAISADGRYVAFASGATNLVPGDTNGFTDIFVHDMQTGQTSRVSVASDGSQTDGTNASSAISADGRYVAFDSSASNLVPEDTNRLTDVFVHDVQTGQNIRASVSTNGGQAGGGAQHPAISGDGRFVAFDSASGLVPDDNKSPNDIYVHDMQTGWTTRSSVASDGTESNGSVYGGGNNFPAISSDGRFVAFSSDASNLVTGTINFREVYLHDRGPDPLTDLSLPLVVRDAVSGW